MNPRIAIYERDEKRMKCDKRKRFMDHERIDPAVFCSEYRKLFRDYADFLRMATPITSEAYKKRMEKRNE